MIIWTRWNRKSLICDSTGSRKRPLSEVSTLDRNDYLDPVESQINDFRVDEEIKAAYLQGNWQGENWQVIAGSRFEHDQRDAVGSKYDATTEEFSPQLYSGSESHWLPAVISRYSLSDQTQVRAAIRSEERR